MKSFEGIPYRDYLWPHVLISLIPATVLYLIFKILSRAIRESATPPVNIPENALVCFFHGEQIISAVCTRFWKLFSGREIYGLGYHGWTSYVSSSVWPYSIGWKVIRYQRKGGQKPFDQILEALRSKASGIIVIGTDSGGPYYSVRPSLIELAIKSGRPIVSIRHVASYSLILKQHHWPLPFTIVRTYISNASLV